MSTALLPTRKKGYRVVIYPLHHILLAISPVGANALSKNNKNSSSQTEKWRNLVLHLTDIIAKAGRKFHITATFGRGIGTCRTLPLILQTEKGQIAISIENLSLAPRTHKESLHFQSYHLLCRD